MLSGGVKIGWSRVLMILDTRGNQNKRVYEHSSHRTALLARYHPKAQKLPPS